MMMKTKDVNKFLSYMNPQTFMYYRTEKKKTTTTRIGIYSRIENLR